MDGEFEALESDFVYVTGGGDIDRSVGTDSSDGPVIGNFVLKREGGS